MVIKEGRRYRNKKHGTVYKVTGIAWHSETQEMLVLYRRADRVASRITWARPLWLFREKFESYSRLRSLWNKLRRFWS